MADNPFDQFDNSVGTEKGQNPFDQFDAPPAAPKKPEGTRSYVGASALAGVQDVMSTGARLLEQINPFTTSEEEIRILEKDPKKAQEIIDKNPAATGLSQFRRKREARAEELMGEVKPSDLEEVQNLEYATLDPDKSALLSPKRLTGDVVRNLPNTAILALSGVVGRRAFQQAEQEALAAGATAAAAKAAGSRAAAAAMGGVGAIGEGAVGYAQQAGQAQNEVLKMPQEQLLKSKDYLDLLEAGYAPESAKQILAARVAQQAGVAGGIADMALGKVGGELLGGIVGEGGRLLPRIGRGFATEAGQEAAQSVGEQVGLNIAKDNSGLETPLLEGTGESAVQGAVLGGITGGGFGGIAGSPITAKGLQDRKEILTNTAITDQVVVDTGLTPSQNASLNSSASQLAVPLNSTQQNIVAQATNKGVDPTTALIISGIETGGTYNPTLKNKSSTAHGLFQQLDSSWTSYGGGDRSDVNQQITNGLNQIASSNATLEGQLGRAPTPVESYLAHLLGPRTAASFINAADDASVLDVIRKVSPDTAQQIVDNNGMKGLTIAQAKAMWSDKVNRQAAKLGLNEELTAKTDAGTDLDGLIGELDALAEEADRAPLTARELDEQRTEKEMEELKNGADDPNEGAINAALDAQNDTGYNPTIREEVEPTLPADLRAAQGRFYAGTTGAILNFESDLDRAAYFIADEKKTSARDADYLRFVMDNTGMDAAEARAYGQEIRRTIRQLVKGLPKGEVSALQVARTDKGKYNEGFVSNDEQATRQKYPNPNDQVAFTATPILAATNPEHVGQTLSQVKPGPGEVTAVSFESNVAPPDYVRAVKDTLEGWVRRFSPDMRLIASFRTDRQPGQTGTVPETAWYRQRKSLGRGLYQINARPLYNFGLTEDGSRNSTTQAKAAYSLAHEFGHALVDHEFLKGLNPDQQNTINNLGLWEYFDEEFLNSLPPEKAQVLREYNTLKRAAETNALTGVAWASRWLSPWKLAHGSGSKKGIESFLNKFLGEGSDKLSAKQIAELMQARGDMLSVHEYLAEQMSRYAQDRKLFADSPLGSQNFFKQALDKLVQFFKTLKATKVVAPGTEFAAWVDSLTRSNQETQGEASQSDNSVRASRKPRVRTKPAVAVLPPSIVPPPAESQGTVEALGPSEGQREARRMLNAELRYLRDSEPALWNRLAELVRTGQLEEFKNEIALVVDPETLDTLRWDTAEPDDIPWKETLVTVEKVLPKRDVRSWISDGFRKLADAKYYVQTMRQMAYAHPEVAGLQLINATLTNYKSLKAWLEVDATKAAQAWAKLGKEQRGLMEAGMRHEFNTGENIFDFIPVNGKLRYVAGERAREYALKNKISEDTMQVWLSTKNTYLQHMNTLHNILREKTKKRLAESPATLRAKLKELADTFAEIRAKPFIPQTRFGQFAVQVRADSGNVLHLEYFETKEQRDAAVTALKKVVKGNQRVVAHNYSMSSSILRTIPPQLLSEYANEMELTKDQKKELREMLDLQTSNPQIRRYSSQLAEITGAGKDLLRSYADFMWHDSTNISKMYAREEFNRGLRLINEDRTLYEDDFDKHDELSRVYDFADSYVKHIMNPADEWTKVRSFVVVKQLWGNIKTAIANVNSLAQLWAVASTRQGFWKGTGTTAKTAGGQVLELFDRLGSAVRGGPAEGYKRLAPEERKAMAKAQEYGVLDETFAAQLASFANVGALERLNSTSNKLAKRILWAGMQPQHIVENYTRRVTFLTSFRGYRNEGLSEQKAFDRALQDTLLLQGDNSLVNRPAFMRGKASAFTIYYGYMQNMLYLMSGGYERARRNRENIGLEMKGPSGRFASETVKMWMAYAFLGGLMGLPGAEDLDNILSLVANKLFGKHFSLKEHAYELASAISQSASEFGLDISPRSIVHGNLADATAFGLLPGVDLSASMSLGNAVPGAGGLGELGQKGGGYKFLIEAMGPLGREVDSIVKLFDDDPSLLKKFNLVAPAGIKNFATAWNEMEAGALYPSGGKVTRDLQTGEIRDMTTGEIVARAMGFSPSVQTANRELHYMQKDMEQYWINRRNNTLTQYWEAVRQNDREAMADVREVINDYNEKAPPTMRLGAGDLSRSVAARRKRAHADEAGIPLNKKSRAFYQDLEKDFKGR